MSSGVHLGGPVPDKSVPAGVIVPVGPVSPVVRGRVEPLEDIREAETSVLAHGVPVNCRDGSVASCDPPLPCRFDFDQTLCVRRLVREMWQLQLQLECFSTCSGSMLPFPT